jgi:alcohol dehydrogenase YqhD (iron-dependent ADH family)
MEAFFKGIGLPVRLSDAGIDGSRIDYLAQHTETDENGLLGSFLPLSQEDRRAIFTAAK